MEGGTPPSGYKPDAKAQRLEAAGQGISGSHSVGAAISAAAIENTVAVSEQQQQERNLQPGTPASQAGSSPGKAAAAAADASDGSQATAASLPASPPSGSEEADAASSRSAEVAATRVALRPQAAPASLAAGAEDDKVG